VVPEEAHYENEPSLARDEGDRVDSGVSAVAPRSDAWPACCGENGAAGQAGGGRPCCEAVLESLGDGIVLEDASGQVRLNPAMRALIALCQPLLGVRRDASAMEVVDLLIRPGGELVGPCDIELPAAHGDSLTLNLTPIPLRAPAQGRMLVVRDVTSERNSRRDLYAFISQVSHELRGPLQHIQSYAGLLRQVGELTSDQRAEFIGIIEYEAERLGVMVEDLLQLSRYEQGRLVVLKRRMQLSQLVSGLVARHTLRALSRQISLQERVEPEVWVETDPLRYEQVLGNLLSNALRYVQAGGQVLVTLTRENGLAVLEVSDNGPGMAAETMGRLFEPFYQGPEGRISGGGSGLGLSIGKQLMEALGGEMRAESCLGKGSVFTLTLPASVPDGNP